MIELKSLKGLSIEQLYAAFQNAFADYEMQLDMNQLENMLVRRGFDSELSFGAFDNGNLVAFTFNGIGQFDGVPTAYDTGTGTTKKYRGRGLASEIFNYSTPYLKEAGIKQYLLEVLQHNTGAYKIYRNLGFKVIRELNYYNSELDKLVLKNGIQNVGYVFAHCNDLLTADLHDFCDFRPSWQNSFDSIQRSYNTFDNICAYKDRTLIGYCFFEPDTGDITQIAVHPNHRRQGLATVLLQNAIKQLRTDRIKVINTDPDCNSLYEFLNSINLKLSGKQYEMIKTL